MHHSLSSNDINPDLMGGFVVSPSPPSPGRIPLPAACLGVSSCRGSPVAGREGAGSPFPTGAGPVVIHFQACWPGPVKPPEHCCNTTQRNNAPRLRRQRSPSMCRCLLRSLTLQATPLTSRLLVQVVKDGGDTSSVRSSCRKWSAARYNRDCAYYIRHEACSLMQSH